MAALGEGGREAGSSPHHRPGQNKDITLDVFYQDLASFFSDIHPPAASCAADTVVTTG